tara:strand:- start:6668 stop:7474 length:807 start_codon:yes stop_codon:yes gene_type:complete
MRSKSRASLYLSGLVLVVLVAVAIFFRSRPEIPLVVNRDGELASGVRQIVEVGGVRRPASDIRPFLKPKDPGKDDDGKPLSDYFTDYGTTPPVPADANPQVASAVAALRGNRNPERVSLFHKPQPFDAEEFARNPDAYLNVVEPGRAFRAAQPGPGVPTLKGMSPALQYAEQGESVSLKVKTVAGAPVTFTSLDLGAFENRLTTITVRADNKGVARTAFSGPPGTIGDVNILAASPMTSGQAKYTVHVTEPRQTAALGSVRTGQAANN